MPNEDLYGAILSGAIMASLKINGDELAYKAEIPGPGFAPIDPHRVRTLMAPVLLIAGQQSVGLFRRIMDRLQELRPHARRGEIEGSSHMMPEQIAEAFNRSVRSFLMSST